jgi:hypothetical protein
MSLLNYLNNEKKEGNINKLLKKYNLNNITINSNIININILIELLNKNILDINDLEIIKNTYNNLFLLNNNKLELNTNIYNNLIINKYINFSNSQKKGLNKIYNFLTTDTKHIYNLYGYAGTGKTTMLIEFIVYLLENKFINTVALTAPTNKAVNIMKSKFRYHLKRLINLQNNESNNLSYDELLDILKTKNIKVDFITLHKLLNYTNDYDNNGEKIFFKNKKSNINKYDLVIIDECSMISYTMMDSIFEEINNKQKVPKIILTGDICQLPPVNEKKSIIFLNLYNNIKLKNILTYNDVNKYITTKNINYDDFINNLEKKLLNIDYYLLTDVVRTKNKNIVNLCYNIREWIENIIKCPIIQNYVGNGVYVYKNDGDKNKSLWFNKYIEYYNSNNTSNIILTWTNKQCEYYNNHIRKEIFKNKKTINKYEIGDILILNDFYVLDELQQNNIQDKNKDKSNIFYTSEQIKIINLEEKNKKSVLFSCNSDEKIYEKIDKKIINKFIKFINNINNYLSKEYMCWKMHVNKINELSDNNNLYIIYVIHDSCSKILENNKLKVLEDIKKLKKELNNMSEFTSLIEDIIFKQLWKDYNKIFIEPFANVNIGSCITCHKAQASTYSNVFIDSDDILNNKNSEEAKRCIYTALSRASNEIHILI